MIMVDALFVMNNKKQIKFPNNVLANASRIKKIIEDLEFLEINDLQNNFIKF